MSMQSIPILTLTVHASGAVLARRAVGFNDAQATVQGQKVKGVSPRPIASGAYSDLVVKGTAIVEAGAAFSAGASLIVDSAGRAIAATGALAVAAGATAVTSSAANGDILEGADLPEFVFADALEASTGAGDFVEVLMR